MSQSIKIAIPMAGLGTRMRPHTWSKPKPLIDLAGGTVLDYVINQFRSLPNFDQAEWVFIVGPNQGEQIRPHMQRYHPEKKVHYVVQEQMRGQSHALYLARETLTGPMLMAYSDTLIETDLSFVPDETCDAVAWTKPVEDPRRFGVAACDPSGRVTRLVEKPRDISNNLALVGFYYFRSGERLMAAIEEQMQRDIRLKNEFFLADAINILLEHDANIRTHPVEVWLDAGVPEALLETNRYLLSHGQDNSAAWAGRSGVTIVPPVYIHESAELKDSVIGPYVSVSEGCALERVIVRNSIVGEGSQLSNMVLEDSLLGHQVQVSGQPMRLNLGDQSWAAQ